MIHSEALALQETYRICYYISGHGFGHATRASRVIEALLLLDQFSCHVTVCTQAPRWLFPDDPRVTYVSREVDCSILQPRPYEIDACGSFNNLFDFLARSRRSETVSAELNFLETGQFDIILADASFPYGVAGQVDHGERNCLVVLITNFTFDAIFEKLLEYIPKDTAKHADYQGLVETLRLEYAKVSKLIRLPGYINFPLIKAWGHNNDKILDAGLVYRPALRTKEQTLTALGVPQALQISKILLVQFGGHALADSSSVPHLPDGWICLSTSSVQDARFYRFDSSAYIPDLVSASDLVLGKIGYGTVSECVGMGTPLLYVSREMFAEEPYLLKYFSDNGICQEISISSFESGQWQSAIDRIDLAFHSSNAKFLTGIPDASMKVAEMVRNLCQR